jgi:hypothetical protein
VRRLALILLALYPEAWRRRYGAEMDALLEDAPPGPRALADLARGAVVAHLRPTPSLAAALAPAERARNTISAALACALALFFVVAAFTKSTEDPAFAGAARAHPLLDASHLTVIVGLVLVVAALALAAAPLAWTALRAAREGRRLDIAVLLALPVLALAAVGACGGMLGLWLSGHRDNVGSVGDVLFAATVLGLLAAAIVCWAAPRATLKRLTLGADALRAPFAAMIAMGAGMVIVTAGTAIYLVAIVTDAPGLAASPDGPHLIATTSAAAFSVQLALAVMLTAICALTLKRGARSLRIARR